MNHSFSFSFSHVPAVMKRGRHALIAVKTETGNYILGAKDIYPQGVYRLIGGGLEKDEDPAVGATRELKEELGISYTPDQLQPLATVTAEIDETSTGKHYTFVTYLFETTVERKLVKPADDLDGIKEFSLEQMQTLIHRYSDLSDELIQFQKPGDTRPLEPFRWRDYGKLYGKIHELVLKSAH